MTFRAAAGTDLVDLQRTLPVGVTVSEAPAGNYTIVGIAGSAALRLISDWSSSRGIDVQDINTRRRKLEDVFMELTTGGSKAQ